MLKFRLTLLGEFFILSLMFLVSIFFPSMSTMFAFQLPVLYRLYGSTFRPPQVPYVSLDYETSDVSAYVHGVLQSLPSTDRMGTGGISLNELARRANVSYLYLVDIIRTYSGVLTYTDGSTTYAILVSKVEESFATPSKLSFLSDLWTDWIIGRPVHLRFAADAERFREAMNYVGRPVIKTIVHANSVEMFGTPLRNYSMRSVKYVPRAVVHKYDSGCI